VRVIDIVGPSAVAENSITMYVRRDVTHESTFAAFSGLFLFLFSHFFALSQVYIAIAVETAVLSLLFTNLKFTLKLVVFFDRSQLCAK